MKKTALKFDTQTINGRWTGHRAAKSQESDLRQRVTTLVSLFEPMTLLMMGAMVLGIVLAVLLPILNLNQLVK